MGIISASSLEAVIGKNSGKAYEKIVGVRTGNVYWELKTGPETNYSAELWMYVESSGALRFGINLDSQYSGVSASVNITVKSVDGTTVKKTRDYTFSGSLNDNGNLWKTASDWSPTLSGKSTKYKFYPHSVSVTFPNGELEGISFTSASSTATTLTKGTSGSSKTWKIH